jgi:hypothetical protein
VVGFWRGGWGWGWGEERGGRQGFREVVDDGKGKGVNDGNGKAKAIDIDGFKT